MSEDIVPENFNFQGVGIFLPSLEKFKLYQEFFRAGNIWKKNKQEYWKHEKAILHWAYSKKHQHLGSPLTTDTFKREYGLPSQGVRLCTKNALVLAEEMKAENGNKIEHIMANLVVKGLADIITRYRDVRIEDKNNYFVHSIVINRRGLLVGELVDESEMLLGLWKYKLLKLVLFLLIILLFTAIIFTAINQIFNEKIGISFSSFFDLLSNRVINLVMSVILFIIVITYFWRKTL